MANEDRLSSGKSALVAHGLSSVRFFGVNGVRDRGDAKRSVTLQRPRQCESRHIGAQRTAQFELKLDPGDS